MIPTLDVLKTATSNENWYDIVIGAVVEFIKLFLSFINKSTIYNVYNDENRLIIYHI